MTDRLVKLRSLHNELCQKSQTWSEAFETRDWIITKIRDIIQQGKNDIVTKEDIINKLEDFICVIEPEEDDDDK
jgi:hypothetical protein